MFALLFVLPLTACASLITLPESHDFRSLHAYEPVSQAFDPRDGWNTITVTDMPYKYVNASDIHGKRDFGGNKYPEVVRDAFLDEGAAEEAGSEGATRLDNSARRETPRSSENDSLEGDLLSRGQLRHKRAKKAKGHSQPKKQSNKGSKKHAQGSSHEAQSLAASNVGLGGVVNKAIDSLGKATDVIITWYTGQDLKNPSCWANGNWAPTDESFVCALTLEGWIQERPKCFSFLELCNGPSKCIFVRVVDTCAGCAKGSHHVDLTRSAFTKLADLDVGKLTVKMRLVTLSKISKWDVGLWGPRS